MVASHCPILNDELKESERIEQDVIKKAVERAKYENLDKDERLKNPGDQYYGDLGKYAMYKCAYY